MKIGILTFTKGQNIGQRLQNYALQEALRNRGHDVYTICQYKPFIKKIYGKIRNMKKTDKELRKKIKESEKTFCKFDDNYIAYYDKELSFYQDRMRLKGIFVPYFGNGRQIDCEFDGFIVGSDQVWNPMSPDVGENFFLRFTERDKRYNYAPSFSCEEIPIEKIKEYKKWLNGFPNLTVREQKGADIIRELTGRKAQVVVDPTLLLKREEWNKVKKYSIQRPVDKKYILVLFLGEEPISEITKIKDKMGFMVLNIKRPILIAPDEFIDIMEHAEIVLTDSYHVTVFSIIYHIPFINFERKNGKEMNSRFDTLYYMAGIQGRKWADLSSVSEQWLNMEYESTDQVLKINRENSLQALEMQGL